MSFTTCSAGAFIVTGFFLIFTSMWGQDEPKTLRYAITLNCSMGADGGQTSAIFDEPNARATAIQTQTERERQHTSNCCAAKRCH